MAANNSQTSIVQATLDFLHLKMVEQVAIADVAKAMGYSIPHLCRIFKTHTGKGVMAHLLDLRIERAKELLRKTNLNVSEIALQVGFNSHTSFGIAFLNRAKLSPREYRKRAKSENEHPGQPGVELQKSDLWFGDSMANGFPSSKWEVVAGEWKQDRGCVWGCGEEAFGLGLRPLLPENFEMEFEAQVQNAWGAPASLVRVAFGNQNAPGQASYMVDLGGESNTCSAIRRGRHSVVISNSKAIIKENRWVHVRVVFREDTLTAFQDGEERLSLHDPFPAIYENRCRLSIEGWRSIMLIRNLKIRDLGFLPFTRAVRQGDALFNFGLYEQAQKVYLRMHETSTSPADATELQFKIGTCLLRKNETAPAKEWAQKAGALGEEDFWSQHALLSLLEIDYLENRIPDFVARLTVLFTKPMLRDRLRDLVDKAAADYEIRGFAESGFTIRKRLLDLENPASTYRDRSLSRSAEALIKCNRFDGAAAFLRECCDSQSRLPEQKVYNLFTLCYVLDALGRPEEARTTLNEIRGLTRDLVHLARSDIYEAVVLRTEGELSMAADLLLSVPKKYPKAKNAAALAYGTACCILVALRRTAEAVTILEDLDKTEEGREFLQRWIRSEYTYPPRLADGEYKEAAAILLADSREQDGRMALHAEQMVKAGIITELGGDPAAAQDIWREVQRAYPASYCNFFADLAGCFLGEKPDCLEQMPYPHYIRSEMFYLAGLLFEKRGDPGQSQRLLKMSAAEDLTNWWPAVLARKRIGETNRL